MIRMVLRVVEMPLGRKSKVPPGVGFYWGQISTSKMRIPSEKNRLGILLLLIVIPGLLAACCKNELVSTIESPDGKNKAFIFVRNCGATTDWSSQITIEPASKKPELSLGNIYRCIGVKNTGAKWIDAGTLLITTSCAADHESLKKIEFEGIQIKYKQVPRDG